MKNDQHVDSRLGVGRLVSKVARPKEFPVQHDAKHEVLHALVPHLKSVGN